MKKLILPAIALPLILITLVLNNKDRPNTIANSPSIPVEPKVQVIKKQQTNENLEPDSNNREFYSNNQPLKKRIHGIEFDSKFGLSQSTQISFSLKNPSAIDYRIRKNDPLIDKIRTLTKDKILKSESDTQDLQSIFSSSEIIEKFSTELSSSIATSKLYRDDIQRRSYQIEYFSDGLSNPNNLKKQEILRSLEKVFLSENIDTNLNMDLKKAIAFEKVEILKILAKHDTDRVKNLTKTIDEFENKKILKYALSQIK